MDVLPLAVSAIPDASFLRLAGPRPALAVNKLSQADVSDAGCVLANQVHVGVQDGGVYWLAVLSQNCKHGEDDVRGKNEKHTQNIILIPILFLYSSLENELNISIFADLGVAMGNH